MLSSGLFEGPSGLVGFGFGAGAVGDGFGLSSLFSVPLVNVGSTLGSILGGAVYGDLMIDVAVM